MTITEQRARCILALIAGIIIMPTAISQETSSYTGGTFAWDNSKRGSLTVPGGKDGELARIDMDTGKIYWNKREVTTDDDFRKVMMALAKGLWAKPCVKP